MPMSPRVRLGFIIGILLIIAAVVIIIYYTTGLKADVANPPAEKPTPHYALELKAQFKTTTVTNRSDSDIPARNDLFVTYNEKVSLTWKTEGFNNTALCTPSDNWKGDEELKPGNISGTSKADVPDNPTTFSMTCKQVFPDGTIIMRSAEVVAKPSFKTTLTAITPKETKQVSYDPTDPSLTSKALITLDATANSTLSWLIEPENAPGECQFTGDWAETEENRGTNGSETHKIDKMHVFNLNCTSDSATSGPVQITIKVGPSTTEAPTPTPTAFPET